MYLLVEPSEVFLPTCKVCMLPATLPDIESDMHALLLKKQSVWFKAIKSTVHVYSEFCALN